MDCRVSRVQAVMVHDRRAFLSLATVLAGCALTGAARAGEQPIVYVAPLGDAPGELELRFIERALVAFYAVRVRRLQPTELPKRAYYAKRRRYRAERLLEFLKARMPPDGLRILGVTAVDISTTKPPHEDWGILGLAELGTGPCVVSSFRCKRRAKDAEHARIRLGKTCVHELGHTLGLPHCPTRDCLMHDGDGSVLTTDREFDLCSAVCRPRLVRAGHELSASTDTPWPKP